MKCFALTMLVCWLLGSMATAAPKGKAAEKWVEQQVVTLAKRQVDGDSFGITIKTPKGNPTDRTYRLYGVDCPESNAEDKVVENRIRDQAEYFGCKPEEIPGLGKTAAEFTEKLLNKGNPVIRTRGIYGKKVQKSPGRPQRYYALVEVTGPDGKRHWLHELLLEAGHGRAFGMAAPWPPEIETRHGEKVAEEKFMESLKRLEKTARRDGLGVWKKLPEPAGRFR